MIPTVTKKADYPSTPGQIAALLFLVLLIFFGFSSWLDANSFHALAGDDVRSFMCARESFSAYNDFFIQHYRFRPVTAFLGRICALATGGEFDQLRLIAIGVHTLNALLFCRLLTRVIEIPLSMAFAISMAATFTRFTNYLTMAETGVLESMGVTLFLLFLWSALKLLRTPKMSLAAAMVLLFALIIHLHERYIVLFAAILTVAAFIYKQERKISLFISSWGLLVVCINILVKMAVLHTPVLTGTTTQPIDFTLATKLVFFANGMLNLVGINRGPSYLSLYDFLESPLWLKTISITSAVFALLLLIGMWAKTKSPAKVSRLSEIGVLPRSTTTTLIVFTAALVLSASVTFRQEYRWLYPAYLAFLVLLADTARCWTIRRESPLAYALLGGFLVCVIPRELAIRSHRENFYQYTTCQTANALYELINSSPALREAQLITIGGDELSTSSWVFMDGMFSRYYRLPPLRFLNKTDLSSTTGVVVMVKYDRTRNKFSEVPPAASLEIQPEFSTTLLGKARLVSGTEQNLSTPNGTRVVPFTFGGNEGFALVAPVELQLQVEGRDKLQSLHMSFSHLWKKGGAVQVDVLSVNEDAKTTSLLSTAAPPLKEDSVAEWLNYRIALPADCKTIVLRLNPATGNQSSTWIMLRQFLLK